jgi:hypothetical protein
MAEISDEDAEMANVYPGITDDDGPHPYLKAVGIWLAFVLSSLIVISLVQTWGRILIGIWKAVTPW